MSKHPMIEKLGLKVKAVYDDNANRTSLDFIPPIKFVGVSADDLEKLLSSAKVVTREQFFQAVADTLKGIEFMDVNGLRRLTAVDIRDFTNWGKLADNLGLQPIEPCKHEPDEIELKNEYYLGFFQPKTNAFVNEKCGESSVKVFGNKCTHCGIELEPIWQVRSAK